MFENADWAAAFATQPEQFDYVIGAEEIEGEIPPDLRGTLFRNGPANFVRGREMYRHMLDGDGYIVRLSFRDDGKVEFKR